MVPSERTVFTMAISTKLMVDISESTLTLGHPRRRLKSIDNMVNKKLQALTEMSSCC